MEQSDHLFRHESGRMVAALTRIFGVQNLALAEDVVQDAFCRAVEVWKYRGVPENPAAWLMMTARNRAIDVLRRERRATTFAPELGRLLESEWTLCPTVDELLNEAAIRDDELRMMFSCADPRIAALGQIALMLHLLCGFSVGEIAGAFLQTESAVEKRLTRAKKVLAGSHHLFDLNDSDFTSRLGSVHKALYLLFNEGYHGASSKLAVRSELCEEAMRLARLLRDNTLTSTPSTFALGGLMALHAGRLPAKVDDCGNLTSLQNQDRNRWNAELIEEGLALMDQSAFGPELTEYHLEAAIASVHAVAPSVDATDWSLIVALYDQLLAIRPSPVIALNRAIAVSQAEGPERGLQEIGRIEDASRLERYPFYFAALGELELLRGSRQIAEEHFQSAKRRSRNPMERRFYDARIAIVRTND